MKKNKRFPKWSYVKTRNVYYLVMTKGKYKFISRRAAESWSNNWIEVNEEDISHIPTYGFKGFRPGTVIRSVDNRFWYIEDDLRREITTPDFFTELGFTHYIKVSNKEIEFHQEGQEIDDI